jgi:hypothetical protein
MLDSKIQYRHRSHFDALVRKHMPRSLGGIAMRVLNRLPRGLRPAAHLMTVHAISVLPH